MRISENAKAEDQYLCEGRLFCRINKLKFEYFTFRWAYKPTFVRKQRGDGKYK